MVSNSCSMTLIFKPDFPWWCSNLGFKYSMSLLNQGHWRMQDSMVPGCYGLQNEKKNDKIGPKQANLTVFALDPLGAHAPFAPPLDTPVKALTAHCTNTQPHHYILSWSYNFMILSITTKTPIHILFTQSIHKNSLTVWWCFFEYHWYFKLIIEIFTIFKIIGFDGLDISMIRSGNLVLMQLKAAISLYELS